jgi:hypothetical protein
MKKVTLWEFKENNAYAPISPEFVNYDDKDGNVTDITEAMGEDFTDVKTLLEHYQEIDHLMAECGLEYRFTKGLLEQYEPVIVEMTGEQYRKWIANNEGV